MSYNERLAQSMSAFLAHDVRPATSACTESTEEPGNASECEAPDADATAMELTEQPV